MPSAALIAAREALDSALAIVQIVIAAARAEVAAANTPAEIAAAKAELALVVGVSNSTERAEYKADLLS